MKIEDTYGDTAEVSQSYGKVYLVTEYKDGGRSVELSLTPKQTKQLRKALKAAELVARGES